MSLDILRDSASARRQQSRNLKGEGYIEKETIITIGHPITNIIVKDIKE